MDWKKLFAYLQEKSFTVYSPGQHEGDCILPYLVVALAGTQAVQGISTDMDIYEILLYYPYDRYSEMEAYQKSIRKVMAEKMPVVRIYEDFGFVYHDDEKKAYMTSVTYGAYKKR